MSDFVYSCFYIAMLFLLVNHQSKCNLFLAWCMMVSTDTVREKCEERWDGTKHPTIYVWNINKNFYVLSTKKKLLDFKKKFLFGICGCLHIWLHEGCFHSVSQYIFVWEPSPPFNFLSSIFYFFKEVIHPDMKHLWLFTHPNGVPNPYDQPSSVKNERHFFSYNEIE